MAENKSYQFGPVLTDRIISVVKRVDSMPYQAGLTRIPTRFEDEGGGPAQKSLRVCTFTGSWTINETKTLTFQGVTSTPNTVVATNQLFTIGDACDEQVAYIGKVSSLEPSGATADWHLLNVQHHETSVMVSVTLTTAAIEFTRIRTWIPYPGETATLSLPISTETACS
jgi:hypothetical protein